jgi:hypothetical protein
MSRESLGIPTEWWLDWSGLPHRLTWYGFFAELIDAEMFGGDGRLITKEK